MRLAYCTIRCVTMAETGRRARPAPRHSMGKLLQSLRREAQQRRRRQQVAALVVAWVTTWRLPWNWQTLAAHGGWRHPVSYLRAVPPCARTLVNRGSIRPVLCRLQGGVRGSMRIGSAEHPRSSEAPAVHAGDCLRTSRACWRSRTVAARSASSAVQSLCRASYGSGESDIKRSPQLPLPLPLKLVLDIEDGNSRE